MSNGGNLSNNKPEQTSKDSCIIFLHCYIYIYPYIFSIPIQYLHMKESSSNGAIIKRT